MSIICDIFIECHSISRRCLCTVTRISRQPAPKHPRHTRLYAKIAAPRCCWHKKKRAGPHCRVRPLLSDGSHLRLLFALELVAQVLEKALALHVVLVLHALVKGI